MATHDAQGRELYVCSKCRCRRVADEFELDRHGRRRKCCKACKVRRDARKCQHGRQRHTCRECGGSSFCEHDHRRDTCRECGGSAFCEHNRRRDTCRDCGGTSICEHGRQRYKCRECGGASICEHGRQRYKCRECGGTGICEHGRQRNKCRECGGASICEHGRERRRCCECDHGGYLRHLVSSRIQNALHTDKDRGSLEYLGCSIDEFKAHIESTFEPGMTWENHGAAKVGGPRVWNIDHIVPIKFETVPGVPPTLEEVIARLHWTNTQAMWAEENIAKCNRFVGRARPAAAPEVPKLTDEDIDELLADLTI